MGQAHQPTGQVEPFPRDVVPRGVTEQLGQIRDMLAAEFPQATSVTLDLHGALRAHIDVRDGHDIPIVEARLPVLCGGMFNRVSTAPRPTILSSTASPRWSTDSSDQAEASPALPRCDNG